MWLDSRATELRAGGIPVERYAFCANGSALGPAFPTPPLIAAMTLLRIPIQGRGVLFSGLLFVLATAVGVLSGGCSGSNGVPPVPANLQGVVSGPSGVPVAGAIVYLVPTSAIPTQEITAAGVLAGTTEEFDEPLEDAVALLGSTFVQATTDAEGKYDIATVSDGDYYLYVEPTDTEHFPGGSFCRTAAPATAFRGTTRDIVVSSSPPDHAVYVGMSTCLICHEEYSTEKTLAHRLGFRVPGVSSPLQDISEHPEIDDGLEYFIESADHTGGTAVYHYDHDGTRGFDEFKTSLSDPSGAGGIVYAKLWLWKDAATGEHKITIENVGNPGDTKNFAERVVKLTYGGAVHKQRYMIEWPNRNGLYPILQFQTLGDDARYDRTRKVFRDYHLDFYWSTRETPGDPSDDLIRAPSITNNISRNCIGCHAPDYRQFEDPDTGEILCTTREDINGEYDIDGNGQLNDLNVGCENCHGPGSIHVSVQQARYIVSPEYLSPSRDVQLCGRCHDRQAGADPIGEDHPLSADSEFPLPGLSRGEYLADYVSRAGPAEGSFWADFTHSKSHHQQTPDFIKSAHYRNERHLLACSTCHDMHGGTGYRHGLIADPDAPDSPLCMICHGKNVGGTAEHTTAALGVTHGPATSTCVNCHMVKTAKTGSGRYGFLLDTPDGTSGDTSLTYFENDITSHVFDVPGMDNVGVQGVEPASAMPIPYTNSCGTCHDPSQFR